MTFLKYISPVIVLVMMFTGCQYTINLEQERENLLETDREFAKLSVERTTAEAFKTYVMEDAMVFPAGENPIVGREAIYNDLKDGEHEYTIDWEPQDAEVAKSGEMGWIWGTWTLYKLADETNIKILYGKYLDVWKKQEDGSWKLYLDMGNSSPAPDEE